MKERLERALYFYQRAFWYINQAKQELLKPLGFWNETILILTFLAVSDVKPGLWEVIGYYLIVLALAAIAGKVIVATGIVRYNTRIANHQNTELMDLHKKLDELKKLIQEKNERPNS